MSYTNIKPLIAPLQQILLKKGKCVACLRDLKDSKKEEIDSNHEKVICACRREYIHSILEDTYVRAEV